ncbi:hypothetical protein CHUAL_007197 [Chamberlinius hualienensis]
MASFEQLGLAQTLITFILSIVATMGYGDEIRCYCNLSVCVSTGYMCKSSAGACFSEVSPDGDIGKARHGCLHLLRPTKREVCEQRLWDNSNGNLLTDTFPFLSCCSQDMCNYMDCLDIKIHIHTKANQTYSQGAPGSSSEDREPLFGNAAESQPANGSPINEMRRQDLWFKAAVIAVPIAGGFILIMLILLAVHLLRKDNRRQRQMVELKRLKQMRSHLLMDDESGNHHKQQNLPQIHHHIYDEKKNMKTNHNIYKNVNLAISRDNKNYCVMVNCQEKQLTKDINRYDYNLLLEKPINTDSRISSNWDDYRRQNHDKFNKFKSSTPV